MLMEFPYSFSLMYLYLQMFEYYKNIEAGRDNGQFIHCKHNTA